MFTPQENGNARYERKFVTSHWDRHSVEGNIKNHPSCFREIFHQRKINNIYFDTPDLRAFYDNSEGNPDRKKFRIRWYGETFGKIEKPVLEIKLKKAYLGSKLSFPLKPFIFDASTKLIDLRTLVANSNLPDDIFSETGQMTPVLYNSYNRKYFKSFDSIFRVTVDSDLQFIGISSRNNSFLNKHSHPEKIIVELKYDQQHNDKAHLISSHLPYRYSKSSKYSDGISLTRRIIDA